jgi:hypothetical protein
MEIAISVITNKLTFIIITKGDRNMKFIITIILMNITTSLFAKPSLNIDLEGYIAEESNIKNTHISWQEKIALPTGAIQYILPSLVINNTEEISISLLNPEEDSLYLDTNQDKIAVCHLLGHKEFVNINVIDSTEDRSFYVYSSNSGLPEGKILRKTGNEFKIVDSISCRH